jgi:hypothetical protein
VSETKRMDPGVKARWVAALRRLDKQSEKVVHAFAAFMAQTKEPA